MALGLVFGLGNGIRVILSPRCLALLCTQGQLIAGHERTIALLTQQHVDALQKTGRKYDRDWGKICDDLQKQVSGQQHEVVRLELQRERYLRVGKEREEALLRKVAKGQDECNVSHIPRLGRRTFLIS